MARNDRKIVIFISALAAMMLGCEASAQSFGPVSFNGRAVLENSEARFEGQNFDESEIRQLRLIARLRLNERWAARADWEASSGEADINGGFLEYRDDSLVLRFGQTKLFTGLNVAGSLLATTFVNRPAAIELTDALTRQIGVTARYRNGPWRLQGGIYHRAISDGGDSNDTAFLSRVVWTEEDEAAETITHIGFNYRHRDRISDGSSFEYTLRPETRALQSVISSQLPSTRDDLFIAEFLYQKDRLTLDGELLYLDASNSRSFGGYGDISYFFGGRKGYRSGPGALGLSEVDHGIFAGGPGALEVAFRLDFAQLEEDSLEIQQHLAQEVALIWHMESNFRLQFGFARADTGILNDGLTAYSVNTRLQISF